MTDSLRWMLIMFAAAIASFALWTLGLVMIALMADSGGKDPELLVALALLWSVAELVWTWFWVKRRAQSYPQIPRGLRMAGEVLAGVALITPAPEFLVFFIAPGSEKWIQPLCTAVTILCCWAARLLWSRGIRAQMAEAGAG